MKDKGQAELLEKIDEDLSSKEVAISARPPLAVALLQKGIGTDEEWTTESPQVRAVFDWYECQYGEKILHDFRPGRLAILVRGDTYLMQVPLFLGRLPTFFISIDSGFDASGRTYNILNCIKGITLPRRKIAFQEGHHVAESFRLGLESYTKIRQLLLHLLLASSPAFGLLQQSLEDHLTSTDMIMRNDLGGARFQVLQAAEKAMKACCVAHELGFPRNHQLTALARSLRPVVSVPANLLAPVQCTAGVRYGEGAKPTLAETIQAHHMALRISSLLAPMTPASAPKENHA